MAQRPDPTLCTVETFRRLVEAAPGEVEGLVKRGVIQRAGPGRISLIPAVRAYVEHTKSKARNASLTAAQEAAKAARAEASELALMVERREMVADDEAQAALDHLVAAITSAISCIPARVSRDLAVRSLLDVTLRAVQAATAGDLMR